jgi:hypothetical protein
MTSADKSYPATSQKPLAPAMTRVHRLSVRILLRLITVSTSASSNKTMRLMTVLVAGLSFANTAAAQYTAQTLDPPSGVAANASTQAYAINNRGQVFGFAFEANARVPVLWTNGVPARLPVPAGYYLLGMQAYIT